jgi:tetratricopeptide (TPR) repeat protein
MTDDWHISAAMLQRFLKGKVHRGDAQRIVRHLLQGCDRCARLVQGLVAEGGSWYPSEKSARPRYQDPTHAVQFADSKARRRAEELVEGWGRWAYLAPLSPEDRLARVLANPGLHTVGFYERLLEAGRRYGRELPHQGVEVVALALVVAERLDPEELGGVKVHEDVLAGAHAALGNAKRIASDFEGSRTALNEAWRHIEQGTGNPLCQGNVISLEASWMIDMGEFEMAETSLEEALALYRSVEDRHHEGRVFIQMATAIGYVDPARGISHLRSALPLINRKREPRLELYAEHELAWFLADLGRADEALAVLDAARPLYQQFPDDWMQFRLHWLEGRVARALGKLPESEHIFRQLSEDFRKRNLRHEFVLVSLDLAVTQVAGGAFEQAARLAARVYPVLVAWGLNRYALAAWLMLQNALELRQLDDLLARLEIYFRRHWHRPAEFAQEGP